MRKLYLILQTLFVLSFNVTMWASPFNGEIILSKPKSNKPHLIESTAPTARLVTNRITSLHVELNASHYSSYSITITPSDGSSPATIIPTSAMVTIPIDNKTLDYVVTIDGGDYGLYDGVFNTRGDSITITDTMAHKIIKNRRQINTYKNFAFYTLNSLVNDSVCCIIDSIPSVQWASSNQDKCLVFVDETPTKGWLHDCSYYYLPRQMSMTDSLNVLFFQGQLPPRHLRPTSVKMSIQASINDFKTPSLQFKNTMQAKATNLNNAGDSKYIIFGPPHLCNDGTMHSDKWKQCAEMYTILRHKYNVSPDDIYVLMGNEDGTMIWFYNSTSNWDTVPMPKDLDGDGYDENILPATASNVYNVFMSLSDKNDTGHLQQLFIYYAGAGGTKSHSTATDLDEVLLVFDDHDLASSEFADLIYQVDADFVSSYFDFDYGYCMETYLTQDHVLMVPMAIRWVYPGSIPFNLDTYSHHWLGALAEADLKTNEPINSDADNNGIVTFKEVTNKADTIFKNYCDSISNTNNYGFYDNYISSPGSLADSLAINYVPAHSLLRVFRDSTDIYWDSPDIWVRNQNDGLTNQENEHLKLVDGQPLYIYVRVHNVGNLCSTPNEKAIKLFAAPISECSYDPMFFETDYVGYEIGTIDVDSISVGNTKTFCFEWNWYDNYDESGEFIGEYDWQNLYSSSGNMLPIRILAFIGNDADFSRISQYASLAPEAKWTVKDHVAIQPRKGALFKENTGSIMIMPTTGSHFDIPINEHLSNLEIIVDTVRSTNISNGGRISLELSDDLYNSLNNGGAVTGMTPTYANPKKFRISENHAQLSNIGGGRGNFYVRVHSDVETLEVLGSDADIYFYVVLRNDHSNITRGYTVHSFIKGNGNSPITPFVLATPIGNNNYTLSETKINDMALYEWYNSDLNKIDEGKAITANKSEIGDLAILKVTQTSTNSEQYAVATLDGTPTIAHASPLRVNDYINVQLTDNAIADMSICLMPVINSVSPIEQAIPEGSNNVTLNTAMLPAGQYVLCLMHNNNTIHSMNILKLAQ